MGDDDEGIFFFFLSMVKNINYNCTSFQSVPFPFILYTHPLKKPMPLYHTHMYGMIVITIITTTLKNCTLGWVTRHVLSSEWRTSTANLSRLGPLVFLELQMELEFKIFLEEKCIYCSETQGARDDCRAGAKASIHLYFFPTCKVQRSVKAIKWAIVYPHIHTYIHHKGKNRDWYKIENSFFRFLFSWWWWWW